MPTFLAVLCYFVAAACFFVTAVTRNKYDTRVNLLALGLFAWVLVPLVDAARALD